VTVIAMTPAPRRTQAERSAATREKLIDAAITALHRYGYAATSTTLVADLAGVSRGAMVHQFPTKADLMAATVQAIFQADLSAYRGPLGAIADPGEKLIALVDLAWERFRAPSGVAQTEIWNATRSDPSLAAVVLPIHDEIIAATKDAQAAWFAQATGDNDRTISDALLTLNVAALRGLAMERALGASEASLATSVDLLRDQVKALVRRVLPA
jgi:AcrR family transcriptional regulator